MTFPLRHLTLLAICGAMLWSGTRLRPARAEGPVAVVDDSKVVSASVVASKAAPARFDTISAVSTQFRGRMNSAAESVPDAVWNKLRTGGWRVQLAEFVVDAVPSLRGVRPRGWPENTTWENTEAVHLPRMRLLVFAEKRKMTSGEIQSSPRSEGVFRHEVGHAFDLAAGGGVYFRSSSADFVKACDDDASAHNEATRAKLLYYLQAGDAGRQEVFAELFAAQLGGGSDAVNRDLLLAAYPQAAKLVRTLIDAGSKPLPKPDQSARNLGS